MSEKEAETKAKEVDPYHELARELGKLIFKQFEEELLKRWDVLENDGKSINIREKIYYAPSVKEKK